YAFQRPHDHRFDPGILDPLRRPRARLVPQPVEPPLDKAPTPLATVAGSICSRAATCLFWAPSAQARTIRARSAPRPVVRLAAIELSCSRSSPLTANPANCRLAVHPPRSTIPKVSHSFGNRRYCELQIRDTRALSD